MNDNWLRAHCDTAVYVTNSSLHPSCHSDANYIMAKAESNTTRMWANAQRYGRPAKHRWRPLFNATKCD